MKKRQVELYDTTLRDGSQMEGMSLSVDEKLKIAVRLDQLGIHYIEGGWPGANPKDTEFFQEVRRFPFAKTKIAAFGSTRKANIPAGQDKNLKALIESKASTVTLVAKSSAFQVLKILETTLEENLAMISDSISFLKSQNVIPFLDAEHFFDGYKDNPEYSIECLKAAEIAGAERLILCDTNGGALPSEIEKIVGRLKKETSVPLGIHVHNDSELAVANSMTAWSSGVLQIQGTINGYGERCGNANILSIIANLKLKEGIDCVTDDQLSQITEASKYVSEISNCPTPSSMPYVGENAFTHKAGLHAAAIIKQESSYQHEDPSLVGNIKHILISDLAGRGNIQYKLKELGLDKKISRDQSIEFLKHIKHKESKGFQYEGAEASFELIALRTLEDYQAPFTLIDFIVTVNRNQSSSEDSEAEITSRATVNVKVDEETINSSAEGIGPVDALDNALRKALLQFYPALEGVKLEDYKVRVVDQGQATAATVRVLIESVDGKQTWRTVGSSSNIIEASWLALSDSIEWWLLKNS